LGVSLFFSCGKPNAANVELRKENQKLNDKIDVMSRQHAADVATLRGYESNRPTLHTLSQERLDQLYTAHGLWFGRATGGDDSDSSKPGDDGLKIAVTAVDEQGDVIKSAGSFKVEAFDLADPQNPLIGTWIFTAEQTRSMFYSHLSLYTFILRCPWQTVPRHSDLTVKVTFDDLLTGRELVAQRQVTVNVPLSPTTAPTTTSVTQP
jgi:hypothetical protein